MPLDKTGRLTRLFCYINLSLNLPRITVNQSEEDPTELPFKNLKLAVFSSPLYKNRELLLSLYFGWMDDVRFYVLFNSISVISGRWVDDNERLCAMELHLRLRRFHLE